MKLVKLLNPGGDVNYPPCHSNTPDQWFSNGSELSLPAVTAEGGLGVALSSTGEGPGMQLNIL